MKYIPIIVLGEQAGYRHGIKRISFWRSFWNAIKGDHNFEERHYKVVFPIVIALFLLSTLAN